MGNKSCKYATGSDGEEKDTRIYRSINSPEGLLCCLPDSKLNLRSMFFKSCNQYAGKNFLGKRHSEKHKYAWMTYEEALSYSEDLAKSIIERELFTKSDEGLRLFGICSQSCPETTLLDFACLQAEITSVSIDYGLCDIKDNDEESFQMQTNSKVEKFKTIVETSNINTLFGSLQVLKTVMRLKKKDQLNSLKNFICFDEIKEELEKECKDIDGFEVYNLNSVINYGSELPVDIPKPHIDSTFTIIFDSEAKVGSQITHQMMCGPIGSMARRGLILENSDIYFSYLPVTSILDRVCIMATTYVGGSIGYSSGNINDLSLDMQALKPTHFYCSSKLLLKFYKKIQASISKKNRIMLRAVKWALSSKSESLKTSSSVDNRMYDRTVLKPLKRSVLGTGMKHIIVGGDYISQEILDFIRISCSTKIWEAYTHKQAAGIISLASADDIIKDHVGGVLEHLEMKLEYVERKDCPEFTCDEDPPTIGRIFIKGPGVVKNYLGSTAKLEENEYWIDTGDVAYVSSAGAIRLLSNQRSKIVLANGEIVDPIRLESLYSELEMIQDVKIQPDTGNSYLKALVYPNKYYNPKKNEIEEDKEIATGIEPNAKDEEEEKEPIEDKEDESEEIYFEATKDDIVIDKDSVKVEDVMSAFKEVVRKHKLPPYEEISDVTMAYEEFGIKNGLLSTSLKIVR